MRHLSITDDDVQSFDPSQPVPASVSAQRTLTNQAGNTVYAGPAVTDDVAAFNPGDWLQLAVPVDPAGLSNGRYNYQVSVTAGSESASYTGGYDFVGGSTGADSLTSTPFGPGWSPSNLYRLVPTASGVILQNPDGTSLWFAQDPDGSYATPAGDFSTVSYDSASGLYTRTLTDGTQYEFNAAGQQVAIVDRNGNVTSYAWNDAGELTAITDVDGQVVTLSYDDSGYASVVIDPANRSLTLGFNAGGQLATLTDADGTLWNYAYTAANQLTSVGDPTAFSYGSAGQVNITLPTGTTEQLTPASAAGQGGAVSLGQSAASFTDGNANTTRSYLDGLGLGQVQQSRSPAGAVQISDLDSNGQAWLTTDALGNPTAYSYDSRGCIVCLTCASIYGDDG